MMQGFFNLNEISSAHNVPQSPRCGLCGLYRTCKSPKMKPTGKGEKKILIIGESPGATEDAYVNKETGQRGKQFIGESGQLLRGMLRSLGIKPDRDCWWDNCIRCRPVNNTLPKNPKPIIDACRPNLINTIKALNPTTIILLGKTSVQSLIPYIWKDKIDSLEKWTGWNIPSQRLNAWVCPSWHPAYLLRQKNDLLENLTRQNLKAALRHTKKPWDTAPDYKSGVEVILRASQAAKAIRDMIRIGTNVSLDLETNALKSEEVGAEIVCCSICQDGKRTIAYPWEHEAVDATLELIRSGIGCVGANLKYEARWFLRLYHATVRRWIWDVVIAAHCLDNRSGITSVKFQSFVLLGMADYNSGVESYLKSAKNSRLNRIRELPLQDVLTYCALDSRIEWELFLRQRKLMKKLERKND